MMEPAQVERFRRELRAMARSADDAEGFASAVALLAEAEEILTERARELSAQGFSAAELARPAGVTRQAFHKRWLRPRRPGAGVPVMPGQEALV